MTRELRSKPSRWFLYWAASLMVLLFLGIILAALMIVRQGYVVRQGIVVGSSMEPHLKGPRLVWICPSCSAEQQFTLDTCVSGKPFQCQACGETDASSGFDMSEIVKLGVQTRPGEKVRYGPTRMFRSLRSHDIAAGIVHASGLKRGDVVVFQDTPNSPREIKRIVGFPGERIAIENGDLFVNGERYCKTMNETLLQSILVEGCNISYGARKLDANSLEDRALRIQTRSERCIDNRLGINAHDSHRIVPVEDFGVAIQLAGTGQLAGDGQLAGTDQLGAEPMQHWNIECTLNSAFRSQGVAIALGPEGFTIESSGRKTDVPLKTGSTDSPWIVVTMVDGFLLVGTPTTEWMRIPLETRDANVEAKDWNCRSVVGIECKSGVLRVENVLVFRDIFYLGQLDSPTQEWDVEDGIVLLGDNVSASTDSRDRWPIRPNLSIIKGIVIEPNNPIENLVQQR
jgi:signal peptidase I